ncbi:7SK snRNA methylphosphate capping enzyme [Denticeps clupeoides]|uniref:RNA methyltransferase n=1 Tax=Denticeps clupeoides TaxID=299321 RepID=A0AAY4DFU9_9TELE|nr:7SK snRNA methylphosphate capping enzyme-like [Denticeps clupeoides]XP_028839063.1 7SK snRNA methylphosphate capping enzyme-like [Denticeps clupeoides]
MIEMSVDKETVLLGKGVSGEAISLSPSRQLPESTDSVQSDPVILGVTVPRHSNGDNATEDAEVSAAPLPKSDTEGVTSDGHVSDGKNGLQQQKQQQLNQPRLNKRRSTMNLGFKHPIFGKRRRRANSESGPVLPTNFLLGGNIFDPLNLNSLMDEEVNRALNAETPKSSPLPAKSRDPVEILIPRDITDPLNLNSGVMGDGGFLVSPLKSGGRKRHRNRHHGGTGGASGQLSLSDPEGKKPGEGGPTPAEGTQSSSLPCSTGGSHLPEGAALLNPTAAAEARSTDASIRDMGRSSPHVPGTSSGTSAATAGPDESSAAPHGPQPAGRQRKRRRMLSRSENASGPAPKSSHFAKGPSPGQGRHGQPSSGFSGRLQHPSNQRKNQQNQKAKFQYGNYNKYYGYRNPGLSEDPRVHVLRPEWFQGKDVLDLGCNTGHLTLTIAKNWRPRRIVGLDIDGGLVHAARQNIRHYLSEMQAHRARRHQPNAAQEEVDAAPATQGPGGIGAELSEKMEEGGPAAPLEASHAFPVSLRISRGPIAAPPLPPTPSHSPGVFPANVSFVRGNYVLENDKLLHSQKEEYDLVLCLSVTKWVHLNWGDAGLKRFFQRVYRHLRPGGLFVLEPQPWSSYAKRKKLTEAICKNYHSIRFMPDEFALYLTLEVGFSGYELLGTSKNLSRGFQRPIYVFHKGTSKK